MPAQRWLISFQRDWWPAVAEVMKWDPRDADKRRMLREACMGAIGADGLGHDVHAYGPHEITALRVFCDHLANPDDMSKAAEWELCKGDYVTYNHALQAKHFARLNGYRRGGRLDRDRFGDRPSNEFPARAMDREEIEQYLVTQASRWRKNKNNRKRKKP